MRKSRIGTHEQSRHAGDGVGSPTPRKNTSNKMKEEIMKRLGLSLVFVLAVIGFAILFGYTAACAQGYSFVGKIGSDILAEGRFRLPGAVALDSSGNIYVVDTWNHRIQKFDSSGTFLAKWGSYGTGDGQFYRPTWHRH